MTSHSISNLEHEPNAAAAAARRWRRWFWQTALTGAPSPEFSLDEAVFQDTGLAEIIGTDVYADLVGRLAISPGPAETRNIAAQMLEICFPHACRCRRHAAMEHDHVSFQDGTVYRSLYFSDASVTRRMHVLFRRTPDINLLECAGCCDVWLQALDQHEGVQHLALLEPDDIARIETDGIWPSMLDRFEDAWVAALETTGRNSPDIRDWQSAHNTREAFERFGKQAASTS